MYSISQVVLPAPGGPKTFFNDMFTVLSLNIEYLRQFAVVVTVVIQEHDRYITGKRKTLW